MYFSNHSKQMQCNHVKNQITIKHIPPIKEISLLEGQFNPDEHIGIAVSGGPDSMLVATLVYQFFVVHKYPINHLHIIHCNHQTRPSNKDDEILIKQFFADIPHTIIVNTSTKNTTEGILRKRRYSMFLEYAKQHNITTIILGHNLTDRIETTLLNLLRWAHMQWFLAMKTKEYHHLLPGIQVYRPLLWYTKEKILELCKTYHIPFHIDPTNNETKTSKRNMLRNTILPKLYTLAHKITPTTNSFIESMRNIYTAIEQQITHNTELWWLQNIPISPYRNATFAYQWNTTPWTIQTQHLVDILNHLHISKNITQRRIQELTNFLNTKTSGYKYFNGTYFFISHGKIYIIKAPKDFRKKTIDTEQKIDRLTKKRFPQPGDTYKRKSRNQRCINHKIPVFRRNFIPIIAKKHNIQWYDDSIYKTLS